MANDRTEYRTPVMRIDAIREIGTRSTGLDTEDQRSITNQLARQIQIEPDPLVRQAIVKSIAEFRTPLALQVLHAGINDQEPAVRIACCEALGTKGDAGSVEVLARVLQSDADTDVRLAATDALGQIRVPEAIQALAPALDSGDPALQFAGVESLKTLSGRDLGGDVLAWKQFVSSGEPTVAPRAPISVAERLRRVAPF